jgi:hypothetical protein
MQESEEYTGVHRAKENCMTKTDKSKLQYKKMRFINIGL